VAIQQDTGDVWFTEFKNAGVGRFHGSALDPACHALTDAGQNPCITEYFPPNVNHPSEVIHSLAIDAQDQVWFSLSAGQTATSPATIGYVPADGGVMRMFPPLSLYPDFVTVGSRCGVPDGGFLAFSAAGIAVDPKTGDIWANDYCRAEVGRFVKQ
jgi:hypothetical protein